MTQSPIILTDRFTSVFFSSGLLMVKLQLGHCIGLFIYFPLTTSNFPGFKTLLALSNALCLLLLSGSSGLAVKYITFSRT